ncbi:MAG: FAD:protein FMN transferase [Actinobacteria bacterium]|nr:FAD:protein FMN transferase [Actinomycetota bacterium]
MTVIPCERFTTLGTTALICATDHQELTLATKEAIRITEELDLAASRFRSDSELQRISREPGVAHEVSATLWTAIDQAIWAAGYTDGLIDPTVGEAMAVLGYSASFADLDLEDPRPVVQLGRVPGYRVIRRNAEKKTIAIPEGVSLDLGATAKAGCADRIVAALSESISGGVLVSLGGDIAIGGSPPEGGWQVAIAARHDDPLETVGPTIALHHGGLASSGSAARRWRKGGQEFHHVIDPMTGQSAEVTWEIVTVAGPTCLIANSSSTASIILGEDAPDWLAAHELPARLQRPDGSVVLVGGWPEETR